MGFLKLATLHPPVMWKKCEDEYSCTWVNVTGHKANSELPINIGGPYFSPTVLCGWIMMSVFLFPMILRPFDFINNFTAYIVGMITYMLLLPTFTNIMQIYSMCNLHDLSWGNRPAAQGTTGQEQLTSHAKKQQALKNRYLMFRINFLFFFILVNGLYIILIDATVKDEKVEPGKPILANDGTLYAIDWFTIYLAAMVLYKLFFAVLHLMKFKCCAHRYTPDNVNLDQEVKRMKKQSLDDSVHEDVLLDIRDYLADEADREDKDDRRNDQLLASISPADFR